MFTFCKHVSHLVWQLHMTWCVIIVDFIQNSFWQVNNMLFQWRTAFATFSAY